MKNKKIKKISFFFSFFYLLIFTLCCYSFFDHSSNPSSITLPSNTQYTTFDLYSKRQYIGSYYYAFTKNGLQFYFLHKKPPISTTKIYKGYFQPFSEHTEKIKEKLGKKVGFSNKEINQLTTKTIFFEEEPLSFFPIFFLSINILFALYSLIECILFLRQLFHKKKLNQ